MLKIVFVFGSPFLGLEVGDVEPSLQIVFHLLVSAEYNSPKYYCCYFVIIINQRTHVAPLMMSKVDLTPEEPETITISIQLTTI